MIYFILYLISIAAPIRASIAVKKQIRCKKFSKKKKLSLLFLSDAAVGAFIGLVSTPLYFLSKEFTTQANSSHVILAALFFLLIIILTHKVTSYFKLSI